MKQRTIGFALFLLAGFFCGFEIYFSTGIVGVTRKPNHIFENPGCFCHGDSSSPGTRVWIDGPDSVRAGTRATYSVHVARDTNIAAGFNVAAFFGSLGIADTQGTQLIAVGTDSLELTHTEPRRSNGRDTISWLFFYHAPVTSGAVDTLYGAGNSVDTSFEPSGDYWNFASNRLIRVTPASDVPGTAFARSFRLMQNYPNPFNPSTKIQFELASSGVVTLELFDVTGSLVRTLVNSYHETGSHTVPVTVDKGNGLTSGVYVYRLTLVPSDHRIGPSVLSRKMVLLR
jgi:hypothetical protein